MANSTPSPAQPHATPEPSLPWAANLGGAFDWGTDGPGGWWIFDEPELHLSGHVLVPDLAGWQRERLPSLPETAWFELAPDWVGEILSPGTARTDRAIKMPIYARDGIPNLWLVDPDARTLEAYCLQDDGHWLLLATLKDDDAAQQPPFEAVGFSLAMLWA